MAVDALTPAELAALGITPGSVSGVGPNAFVGMTPNELKEALDRRGLGYDRALLGSMQQEYASMFGPGAKGGKKAKSDEEEDVIYGGTPPSATPLGTPPAAKDYYGYSPPTSTTRAPAVEPPTTGVNLFDQMRGMGMIPAAQPPSLPSLPGLPAPKGTPATGTGGHDIDLSGFETLDPVYGAKSPSEALAGNRSGGLAGTDPTGGFNTLDPEFGAKSPSEANAGARGGSGGTGGMAPGGYENRGGFDKGSTPSQEAANTGVTASGENSPTGGMGPSGGGDGGATGQGMGGPNGVGNSNDAGSGTPGAGQSGEGGQWRVGTPSTGNDGDDIMDEPVDGQVHEDEPILPRVLGEILGRDLLEEAIGIANDQGLTRREMAVALKDLFGEWAARK